MRFVFFGTPHTAAETLEILKTRGFIPAIVITAPDRPRGRGQKISSPPVKVWADNNKIPTLQPETLDELKDRLAGCDLFIVVAYGKIFPEWLIKLPRYGTLNIHYSLLPKYRGAAPVQAAILANDTETGVTIQEMVKELDAGPIVAQKKMPVGPETKAPELMEKLTKAGAELLVKILPDYLAGKIKVIEQDHTKATFSPKIKKGDGLVDLNDDAIKNYNKFRAFAEWPRTYFFKDKKRFIITDARLEDGKFLIKKVIPEGGKEMIYQN